MNTPVDPKAAEASASPANSLVVAPPRRQEVRVVTDPIPVLDTARFEHMQRIANVMAHSNLVPDALCKTKVGNDMVPLDPQEIMSNCFLVVNQAVRWGMDPFAVAQCVSVVKGKLCYEGKLIAAVLETKLGVKLEYEFSGQNDAMKVVVSATIDGKPVVDSKGRPKTIEGTVADWKTTHPGSPWSAPGGKVRMLRYRGAREWSRVYESGTMLGVYSPDEMEALSDDSRSDRAREVTTRTYDDETPPAPPPRQIAQQEVPPTAPADSAAPPAETADTSFVELAANEAPQAATDDNPPDPSSRPATEQSRPAETGKPSPAAAAVSDEKPAAGEVNLSKALLLKSLGEVDSVLKLEAWLDENGRDMADLEGPDQREVESAFNKLEGNLRKAAGKK